MVKRIQRKRTKGWRMPADTVSVSRPSKWGNPFLVIGNRSPLCAKEMFSLWLKKDKYTFEPERKKFILENIENLRGKNLACWCKEGTPCHADVLLEMANAPPF